jgi:hypothetical protein
LIFRPPPFDPSVAQLGKNAHVLAAHESCEPYNDSWAVTTSSIQVWTFGLSTRSIDDFIKALASQRIKTLVDVRSFPSSKRFPHFLKSNGVTVSHILSATESEPHAYTSAASIVAGELSYRGLF